MGMKVHRSRKTRSAWHLETKKVSLEPGYIRSSRTGEHVERVVMFGFDLAAAGGGVTSIVLCAPPDSFEALAANMAMVDPEATERAFRLALNDKASFRGV